MVPPIISDTFEALEQLGGQAVSGAKQVPKKIAKQIPKALETGFGGQKAAESQPSGDNQVHISEQQQIQKMEEISKRKAAQRYREIQQQILAIARKRQQELPKQITGKPGFSEEKMIKQLEEEKKPEAQRKAEQARKEPLPLQREKRKAEMFRGVAG